ncbi:MAG: DUF58 domain-containing protein [Gammaproteobacteria bacterium]|nr:DUF58 domain-containing protein [Gammaproteobacteria bacterium]
MPDIQHLKQPFFKRFNRQRFSLERFLKGEGPEAGPIQLAQRRVYILPTKRGIFFSVVAFVMLIGALNYNNSLGYSLTFLLTSLGIVAILHTYRNLLNLQVDVGYIAPVFCGDIIRVPLILDNSHYPARFSIRLDFQKQQPLVTDVPANHWIRVEPTFKSLKRGKHPLDRITLRTIFPLGMFKAWAHAQPDMHYLVYPKPDQKHELPNESLYHFNLTGDRGKGCDDFAGLRNYQQGDSLRHVHWKSFAREQGMHTKQFGGDRAEELILDWDILKDLNTEARLSRLTRWVLDAEVRQYSYGLRLPNQQIPLGHGPGHRHRCLEALALFPSEQDGR